MNEIEPVSERLKDLIDDYLSELLDEAGMRELEALLRADAVARRYFVRCARLHTDLHLEARAHLASQRALGKIEPLAPRTSTVRQGFRRWVAHPVFAAAAAVLAVVAGWWLLAGRPQQDGGGRGPALAWLVNAQNCKWSAHVGPGGDLQAGRVLQLESGLAEIRFASGATVVLEGPAILQLLSGHSAVLLEGKLTVRVPEAGSAFEIGSPQGKVIDLGTEFGMSVSRNGPTDVYVFEGKVEAHPADGGAGAGVNLTRNQAARIVSGKVSLQPVLPDPEGRQFVRAIVPPPVIVPRILRLSFDRVVEGTLRDGAGTGIGLTHRLPGTGRQLPERDPNLRLDTAKARLELTTTNSDINTQFQLHHGEYLGVRLSDLGFTGTEDFAVTAVLPNIPALEFVGQFGLYAGAGSDRNIRGGVISRRAHGQYTQFLVNNKDGKDADIYRVGLLSTGADLRLTLERTRGKYSLKVENLTTGSSSTLEIRHSDFLDGERELFVGLFGANTQSEVRKTLTIQEFSATVWTVAPAVGTGRAD
jgi:hypothetical protein